jgi:hypothetical protein
MSGWAAGKALTLILGLPISPEHPLTPERRWKHFCKPIYAIQNLI